MKYYLQMVLVVMALGCREQAPQAAQNDEENGTQTFANPLVSRGADPWVVNDGEKYHYCYSRGGSLHVKTVEDIADLGTAEGVKVWTPPANTNYSKELWAPELHSINGKWYIYVAADDGDNVNHRMYVMGSKGETVDSGFELLGQITDASDKWAIDGTVFEHREKMYFIWSGWEGDVNEAQHLYIAEMSSPVEITSARTRISTPEYEWEKRGSGNGLPTINEGPQILQKDGEVFLTYSASGSWSNDYCLGLLQLTGDDPLEASAWQKFPEPVFAGTDQVISPGHASFISIGPQDWIVYHANRYRDDGWDKRYVKMQPFAWRDGQPVFGEPVADGVPLALPD